MATQYITTDTIQELQANWDDIFQKLLDELPRDSYYDPDFSEGDCRREIVVQKVNTGR